MRKLSLWRTTCLACVFCVLGAIGLPAQIFNSLHSFDGTDGANPYPGPVQGTDGNFYGTTSEGGAHNSGTVFKITAGGTLIWLYSFCAKPGCPDGQNPNGGLVLATDGNFYGTTYGGGRGGGTVFKITAGGTLTPLYTFCTISCAVGANPDGGLVQATDGNFYGTTNTGGAHGYGTVFKITAGKKLTPLYSFCSQPGCTDGGGPRYGALVQATDGNFYGTTKDGGAHGSGTVFKITAGGTLTPLYSFGSQLGDGSYPSGGLVQATDGNFYGTTNEGGNYNGGTVFRITAATKLTTLHSFDGTHGSNPDCTLVQATNGNFYGTTVFGGANNDGTVFSLSVGLGPFVETVPTSGPVGKAVVILGNNLTGTTSVTFNGTAATFTVVSSTEIKTTVPKGATTGKVQVKTPHGTLTSNVNFRVT